MVSDRPSRSGWSRSARKSWTTPPAERSDRVEQRALRAIHAARKIIPEYANGERPTTRERVEQLAAAMQMDVKVRVLDHPCLLLPQLRGRACLMIDSELHRGTRAYVLRHELGHVIAGDADEPALLHFPYPLPEAEHVADLFAFADLVSDADVEQGAEWVAQRMREIVVVEYEPWYLRVPELAARLTRTRGLQ